MLKSRYAILGAALLLSFVALVSLTYAGGSDNPLYENAYTWTGYGGVVLEGVGTEWWEGNTATSTVTISTIPLGSSVVQVYLYSNLQAQTIGTGSATINGEDLGTVNPYSSDEWNVWQETVYRWDATSVVTGNGVYTITTTYTDYGQIYFHELLVIFSNPAESYKQIIVNDGSECLVMSSASTTFHSVDASTTATIYFSVHGANVYEGESASFNGDVLASGDIWNNDHGNYLDIDVFPVDTFSGDNTAGVTTSGDVIIWHLAVLEVVTAPPAGVPEFSMSMPAITSIAMVIYISIRKRLNKKE